MITFYIDELTPCLKEVETGDILDTEVIALKRKSYLSKFNRKTGWYVNWSKMPSDVEIYAVYIHWACTAPQNNIWAYGKQKYSGVGGHLLAIASQKSIEWGHEGVFHADAMDSDLLEHYVEQYGAQAFPMFGRPFHFVMEEGFAQQLREVYTYEWTDEEV